MWITEPLSASHNRTSFSCGNNLLDNYLQKQANQDIKRKLAACFVLSDNQSKTIKGYYTLSNSSIPLDDIPEIFRNTLPKSYTTIPVTLLGRLAVDTQFKGKGIGKLLLIDALKRSFYITQTIGSYAVVVDPIDEFAENFYSQFGFIFLPDSKKMFIAMKTLEMLFNEMN